MGTDESYTMILTKGTHLISGEAAERVRSAIERDEAIVHISLDPFGAVDPDRTTMIAVRHVVAVTKNPVVAEPAAKNVAMFRRPRGSR